MTDIQQDDTEKAPPPEWLEWPDSEIMARLMRRGVEALHAKYLVGNRLRPEVKDEITEELERVYRDSEGNAIVFETAMERRNRR